MKKQFMKITQLAKENFTGAERTDTLTNEQAEKERRVKAIRHSCDEVNSAVGSTLVGSSLETDKRLKGLPHSKLSLMMDKAGEQLGSETLLGLIMKDGGECQREIATHQAEFEVDVEKNVAKILKGLLKNEGQKVDSERDKLSSSRLSMDTCGSELRQAQKSGHTEKVPALTQHLHRASEEFSRLRAQYSQRMSGFLENEKQFCELLVQFMHAESEYHRKCHAVLENKVAEFQRSIESRPPEPLFGCFLQQHLNNTNRRIAQVIEECTAFLLINGVEVQGLFRLAGSATEIKKLKTMYNNGLANLEEFPDVHVVADCLKQYLRELPEPLLTYKLFPEWTKAVGVQNEADRVKALADCAFKLPTCNLENLVHLMHFLNELSKHEEVTKMSGKNIGLVLGPNLLWSQGSREEDGNVAVSFAETPLMARIAEELVIHYNSIFKTEQLVDITPASTNPVAPPRNSKRRQPPPVPQGSSIQGTPPGTPPSPTARQPSGNGQPKAFQRSNSDYRPPPPKPYAGKPAPLPPVAKKPPS